MSVIVYTAKMFTTALICLCCKVFTQENTIGEPLYGERLGKTEVYEKASGLHSKHVFIVCV